MRRLYISALTIAAVYMAATSAFATCSTVPFVFTSGTTAQSSQVNSDFAAVVACVNGIDTGQVTSGTFATARLPTIPLNKGGTNADLSATGPGVLVQATNGAAVTTSAGQLPGTATNDNASAGNIGQYVSASVTSNPGITSGSATSIISISLTAGDWDVQGIAQYGPNGGTITAATQSISTTNNALGGSLSDSSGYTSTTGSFTTNQLFPTGAARLSLSGTTTVYLVGLITATGSPFANGFIRARRVR